MDPSRELRRMTRGDRCGECGSKKWYLQDGLRFCEQGHQIQGFVQFDVGDDADAGRLGAVSRREKEKRDSEKRQLSGRQGKLLYIEALQLMLRNQILWLVDHKEHGEELETVVRDLWDLRIRGSTNISQENPSESHDQLEMFSSQPQPKESLPVERSGTRAQSWDPERGVNWPLPRLLETLALCYLGCVLLRAPVRQGEFVDWVNEGSMPYKKAFEDLPFEMQERMPSAYVKLLKSLRHSTVNGENLSGVVMDLVLSYHLNYKMAFPEICSTHILVQYSKLLSLPVECIVVAKRLAASLKTDFRFHVDKARTMPLDHPETRIVAILIVATKLCFPFRGNMSLLKGSHDYDFPRFNWDSWKEEMGRLSLGAGESEQPEIEKITKITPNQLTQMSEQEFNAYCAQVMSLSGHKNNGPLTRLFASENAEEPVLTEQHYASEIDAESRACRVLEKALHPPLTSQPVENEASADARETGYEIFREIRDLSETAATFYQAACDLAGISLDALVRAVHMQEQQVVSWQERRPKSKG